MDGSLVGKRVICIFSDGNSTGRREGLVTAQDNVFLTLNSRDIIPLNRVIRVEVLGGAA